MHLLMILTGKNYLNYKIQKLVKKECWLPLIITYTEKILVSQFYRVIIINFYDSILECICLNKVIHQTDQKEVISSGKFSVKFEFIFVLTQENARL